MSWAFYDLLVLSLASYAITFVLASSAIGDHLFRRHIMWLIFMLPERVVPFFLVEHVEHEDGTRTEKWFPECRMCVGFYATVFVCGVTGEWGLILPVYGASYLLATQER